MEGAVSDVRTVFIVEPNLPTPVSPHTQEAVEHLQPQSGSRDRGEEEGEAYVNSEDTGGGSKVVAGVELSQELH